MGEGTEVEEVLEEFQHTDAQSRRNCELKALEIVEAAVSASESTIRCVVAIVTVITSLNTTSILRHEKNGTEIGNDLCPEEEGAVFGTDHPKSENGSLGVAEVGNESCHSEEAAVAVEAEVVVAAAEANLR